MSSPHRSPGSLTGGPATEEIVPSNKGNTDLSTHPPVNGAERTSHLVAVKPAEPIDPGEVIQVPSTAPAIVLPTRKPTEAQKSDAIETQRTGDIDEAPNDSDSMASEGTDLPAFDWIDLQHRYTKAIQAVNQEEEDILEEFYRYSDVGFGHIPVLEPR